jgi:hypothetical protein
MMVLVTTWSVSKALPGLLIKAPGPGHYGGSVADTIRSPRLILRLCLDLQVAATRMSSGICLMFHGPLESAMAWAHLEIRHGMAALNPPWHGSFVSTFCNPPCHQKLGRWVGHRPDQHLLATRVCWYETTSLIYLFSISIKILKGP